MPHRNTYMFTLFCFISIIFCGVNSSFAAIVTYSDTELWAFTGTVTQERVYEEALVSFDNPTTVINVPGFNSEIGKLTRVVVDMQCAVGSQIQVMPWLLQVIPPAIASWVKEYREDFRFMHVQFRVDDTSFGYEELGLPFLPGEVEAEELNVWLEMAPFVWNTINTVATVGVLHPQWSVDAPSSHPLVESLADHDGSWQIKWDWFGDVYVKAVQDILFGPQKDAYLDVNEGHLHQEVYHDLVVEYTYTPWCDGDFAKDGDVDAHDLATFAADFGRMDCDSGPVCEADFEPDDSVDGVDLAVMIANFGREDCPSLLR